MAIYSTKKKMRMHKSRPEGWSGDFKPKKLNGKKLTVMKAL